MVHEDDKPVLREDGTSIPCLEIKNHFDEGMYERYQTLMRSDTWIPCEQHIKKVNVIILHQWLHRLLVERLQEKIQPILLTLEENQHNWEETFYQFIAQALARK